MGIFGYIPRFRKPRLAMGTLVTLAFVALLSIVVPDWAAKFAWIVGSAAALFFLLTSGKAARNGDANLGLLMFVAGLLMFLLALWGTPMAVFAASALEDYAPHLIAALGSYFTSVEGDAEVSS